MPITIENPTAEAFFAAFKQLPTLESERFKQLMASENSETPDEEEAAWRDASARSAARFFEEEEGQA